jgi:hypothetical protein
MSRALLSLAGFEVTLIGRFWVTAEAMTLAMSSALPASSKNANRQQRISNLMRDLYYPVGVSAPIGIERKPHRPWAIRPFTVDGHVTIMSMNGAIIRLCRH